MRLIISYPNGVEVEYQLAETAEQLIRSFGSGESRSVTFPEGTPSISRAYPARFTLTRDSATLAEKVRNFRQDHPHDDLPPELEKELFNKSGGNPQPPWEPMTDHERQERGHDLG